MEYCDLYTIYEDFNFCKPRGMKAINNRGIGLHELDRATSAKATDRRNVLTFTHLQQGTVTNS